MLTFIIPPVKIWFFTVTLFQSTIYRSREFAEGMGGIFSLLDQLEDELSKKKAAKLAPSPKIVGGSKAYEGQFPFAASLKIKNLNR